MNKALLYVAKSWEPESEGYTSILHVIIEYIKTGDTDILEALHKDVRGLVVGIAETILRTQKFQNIPLFEDNLKERFLD